MPDWLTTPGMSAHIDAYRAVIRTNSALYTTRRVRYHLSGCQNSMLFRISLENSENRHIKQVAEASKKLRGPSHYRYIRNDRCHDSVINPGTRSRISSNSDMVCQICGEDTKTELPHGNSVYFANLELKVRSYERGTTLAACKPLGPSSTENSTFCSASNLR